MILYDRSKIMRDPLPQIIIKPNTSPHEFIRCVYSLLEGSSQFNRDLQEDYMGEVGHLILKITPSFETEHYDLYGKIINHKKIDRENIRIAITARWEPHCQTYDTYVTVAKQIFDPILANYNKTYNTRLKLNIKSKESLEPKLSPNVAPVFTEFITFANKEGLTLSDWKSFYSFIRIAHSSRIKLNEEGLYRLLIKHGFEKECAQEIASIYYHGRALLSKK